MADQVLRPDEDNDIIVHFLVAAWRRKLKRKG
jgi:hypothetical protein